VTVPQLVSWIFFMKSLAEFSTAPVENYVFA